MRGKCLEMTFNQAGMGWFDVGGLASSKNELSRQQRGCKRCVFPQIAKHTMTTRSNRSHHGAQELDVWCFYYEPVLEDATIVSAYESLLSNVEHQRYRALVFEEDRLIFLASRALIRCALSHYTTNPPEAWCFELGSNGKPRLATVPPCGPLHFNLSNTKGLAVCGVSRHAERLGVDVEYLARMGPFANIANRHFTDNEVAILRAQPNSDKQEAFLRLWTLKESFLKATGKGLSIPLNQFAFMLAPGHPVFTEKISISFTEQLLENAEHWRFAQWRLPGRYIVTLGIDAGGIPLRYHLLQAAPLLPGHGAPLVVK